MGRRFLLVDDSRVMRRLIQSTIVKAGYEGAEFVEAEDGNGALAELDRLDYAVDVVFCDCNMPNLDGMGFLKELGARGRLERCPVIIVTGESNEALEQEVRAAGAVHCIGKPFTPEKIAGLLSEIL